MCDCGGAEEFGFAGYTAAMPSAEPSETLIETPADDASAAAADEIDQSCLDHILGYRISLADIPTKRAFTARIGKPMNLRPVEFTILLLVTFNPGVTQKQLAQTLAMSAPNITILIDRMTEKGLLARVRSETDRRAQNVHPTAEGAALARRAHEASKSMEDDGLAALSPGERTMLFELLHKVARRRRG